MSVSYLSDKIAHNSTVIRMHVRSVSVENSYHSGIQIHTLKTQGQHRPNFDAMLAMELHAQSFADAFPLIIAGTYTRARHVS